VARRRAERHLRRHEHRLLEPRSHPEARHGIYKGRSTDIVGGFDTFGFGFHDWHPSKAFDLYYDDLVLDTARVGCLP
jgi:hypothetical protein